MSKTGFRAFSDDRYDYYELTTYLGAIGDKILVPKGAIFVHDTDDHERGSVGDGCLKLCWTPDGNSYGWLCADTIVFHANFKNSDMFKLAKKKKNSAIRKLEETISRMEEELSNARKQLTELKLKDKC